MFEFILICIFIYALCTFGKIGGSTHHEEEWEEMWERQEQFKERNGHKTFFEEADSYYDDHGDEHLIDDDGYCEECDDYHDW